MAYRADFYIPANIIGYTGVLKKNPTVYFLSSTEYGHITQVHDAWENAGREEVHPNNSYEFGNRADQVLFEQDSACGMTHQSRSPMTLVNDGALPPELTHAIMVHTERKAMELYDHELTKQDIQVQSPEFKNYYKQNIARLYHPGQQPTDQERAQANNGPVLQFWWTRPVRHGVNPGTRLYTISQGI